MKRDNSAWRHLIPTSVGVLSFLVAGCANPLIERMHERISGDVSVFISGPAPSVSRALPETAPESVPTSTGISVTFDMDIDETTLVSDSFKVLRLPDLTPVSGIIAYDATARSAAFTPATRLDVATTYRIVVGSAIKSAKGAKLARDYTIEFTTRYFHDDEIGIELNYSSGDLVLNTNAPIYFQVYSVPLPYPVTSANVAVLSEMPITSSGKYRIPRNSIPQGTSKALVMMFHDNNNNYQPGDDGAETGDSERVIKLDVAGKTIDTDNADDLVTGNADGFYTLNEQYIVDIGTGYAITYADGSPVDPDAFETADTTGTFRQLTQGVLETARNIHTLNDVDYLRFVPPTTDHYSIEVKETTFELEVGVYTSDSDAYTGNNALAGSSGTAERIINTGWYEFTAGTTYYLRIESPTSGLGWYSLSYRLRDVPEDTNESNETPAEATALSFGRTNALEATLGSNDRDVYAITVTADTRYAIEVTELDNYFGSQLDKRNVQFGISMYTDWDGTNGAGIWQSDIEDFYQTANGRLMFDANRVNVTSGSATRWLVIQNLTTTQGNSNVTPGAGYKVLYTWGPDTLDEEYVTSLGGPRSDDVIDGSNAASTEVRYVNTAPILRTLYSGTGTVTPGSDVDWFRIQVRNNMTDYLLRTEPASGEDGIIVEFDVYRATQTGTIVPDLAAGVNASGQQWSGSQDEPVRGVKIKGYQIYGNVPQFTTQYPTIVQSTMFVRVRRSTTSVANPLTGSYRLFFTAGADNEDDQNPDTAITVSSVDYKLDETPWIGKPFGPLSSNFEDRNKLADSSGWSGSSTPIRYNTLHRKTYDFSTGKPDGAALGADFDYLWAEIPAGITNVYLIIIASHESYPGAGMPVQATVRRARKTSPSSALDTIRSVDISPDNEIVTEAELVYVETYDSHSYFMSNQNHQIFQSIPVLGRDVLFIRVERDSTNALPGDPATTEYSIRLMTF